MEKYLRIGESIVGSGENRFVGKIFTAFNWVDKPEEATADYRLAADVTRKELKEQCGLETALVEMPDPRQMESKWVICKQD